MSRLSPLNIKPPFYRLSNVPAWPTLEAAVRNRLLEVEGPTQVYLATTETRAVLPFVVVSPLRYSMPNVTNTSGYWELSPLQVTAFSESGVQSAQIGRACMKALRAAPRLRFLDGYHMTGWQGGTRQWPQSGVGPGGKLAFRFEFDWIFQVGRDLG